MRLVILGAGGHAKVVLEGFRAMGGFDILGLIAAAPAPASVLDTPVLGDEAVLHGLRAEGVEAAFVALGDNALRDQAGARLTGLGFRLATLVHPAAFVSPSARLGDGVAVMARAVVGTGSVLEDLSILNTGAVIDHDTWLGRAAHVAPGCALAGSVNVGARALVGVGSAVRPGIRIGADAIVGAGAAVIRDVATGEQVAGVPARRVPSG